MRNETMMRNKQLEIKKLYRDAIYLHFIHKGYPAIKAEIETYKVIEN